jgi:DNA-binding MarR family transcriptional regulator
MNPPTIETSPTPLRRRQTEQIARDLLPAASQLTRLIIRQTRGPISRSEGGILRSLSTGPKRVTDLAEHEGLAQPTTTVLIKRLHESGWVVRERDAGDGRVVLVSLTAAGAEALEQFRSQYRTRLRDRLATMSDEQIAALADATEALDALVGALQLGDQR